MKLIQRGLITLVVILLSACGNKVESPKEISSPPISTNVANPLPDVGKVDTVKTEAIGYGASPAAATSDAMKVAILQVNGATIDSGSVQAKYGLDITDGKDALSLRATEFAELVSQRSGGAITNFKIIEVSDPKEKGGQYKVEIEANIAHFTAPSESKKIKVVLAPMHLSQDSFVIGTDNIQAQKVAEDIRSQVSVALTNTGRFSVLDREINTDIQSELDLIESGASPRSEVGKLGQAVTADVIWVGTVNSLAYDRHARKLKTSDRELVSYSGGWEVSQKLVNVSTRQVMISDTLQGKAPEIEPTTMSSGVNSNQILQDMINGITADIVSSILTHTFPITVVSIDGNSVVLSQGGKSLKIGSRYAMVTMGKEIKDPQTGESLGRVESSCCELIVDKVGPKLTYGHLENVKSPINNLPVGSLQIRDLIKSTKTEQAEVESYDSITAKADSNKKSKMNTSSKPNQSSEPSENSNDDSKW